MVFSYKSMGYWPAVIAGLATAFAYLGVAAWEGPAFATALNYIVPIPEIGHLWTVQGADVWVTVCLVSVVVSVIITIVNYFGAKQAAVFQTIATVGLIIVGILFLTGGVAFGDMEYTQPLLADFKGFTVVLLMVPAMFVGFDVIPSVSRRNGCASQADPEDPYHLDLHGSCMVHADDIAQHVFQLRQKFVQHGVIPVADAMAYAFGNPIWGKICIVQVQCAVS